MLFRALDTYLLGHAVARSLPHLAIYIETLNTRRQLLTERYVNTPGVESNIVVLLRKILADADIPSLLRKPNDLTCYLDVLSYTAPGLNGIFDAVTTGLSFTDLVVRRNPAHTEEYVIPVQCQDPLSMLPLDQGWDAWQAVRPIRLVDIDSHELTFQTYQDQIVFSKLYPTRAVLTLDVVALVLQYVNLLRAGIPVTNQAEYCHRYVLIHLLQDLQDLWLSNLYTRLLASNPIDDPTAQHHLQLLSGDAVYGYPGVEISTALREVSAFIAGCRGGAVSPATLIKSLLLADGSVPDALNTLLETTTLIHHRQNAWMEYLRDRRWLALLYEAYQLQPEFVATRNLHTGLRRDLPLLCNLKFWNAAHSQTVRQFIDRDIHAWLDRVI